MQMYAMQMYAVQMYAMQMYAMQMYAMQMYAMLMSMQMYQLGWVFLVSRIPTMLNCVGLFMSLVVSQSR